MKLCEELHVVWERDLGIDKGESTKVGTYTTENMMTRRMCGGGEGVPVEKIKQEMEIMNIMDVV